MAPPSVKAASLQSDRIRLAEDVRRRVPFSLFFLDSHFLFLSSPTVTQWGFSVVSVRRGNGEALPRLFFSGFALFRSC